MAVRLEPLIGRTAAWLLLLAALLAPDRVVAQESVIPLQFSFSDPGARSMGFGGAFVALADDATAAFANPAGLVQLVRPEVSIEGRHWRHSTPFTVGGRVEGRPTGRGVDTSAGLRMARSKETVNGLSFLSLAYPKGRWSVAIFRHQLADFEFRGETQGLFGGGTDCCQTRFFDQRFRTSVDLASYGVSGGYRVGETLALGFGVTHHHLSLSSEATMFLPDDDLPEGFLGRTSYLPERSLVTERHLSDSSDWALGGGFLWWLSNRWTVGGVYRQGPDIEIGVERLAGQSGGLGVPPGAVIARFSGVDLELPDMAGLGLTYRAPDDRLTVTFQWDRIDYSSIVESLRLEDRAVDDANELHVGGEYVFPGSTPIVAVRLGAWLDPDHQVRATNDSPFERALLPAGKSQMHFAFGVGVALRRFQVDVGVDLADRASAVSISAIRSF